MAENAGGQAGDEQNNGGGGIFGGNFLQTIIRWFAMYYLMQFVMKQMGFQKEPQKANKSVKKFDEDGNEIIIKTTPHFNLWKPNTKYDLYIYLSNNIEFESINLDNDLLYKRKHLRYTCDNNYFSYNTTLNLNDDYMYIKNNETMYAHILINQIGYPINISDVDYDPIGNIVVTHPITIHRKRKIIKKKSLINKNNEDKNKETNNNNTDINKKILYFKPELNVRMLCDWTQYGFNAIPYQIVNHYKFHPNNNGYYPVIYIDEFWLLNERYIPINDSIDSVNFTVVHKSVSDIYFFIYIAIYYINIYIQI